MRAWDKLLAISSLAVGRAWDLINNIKATGTGSLIGIGTVVHSISENPVVTSSYSEEVINTKVITNVITDASINKIVPVYSTSLFINENNNGEVVHG